MIKTHQLTKIRQFIKIKAKVVYYGQQFFRYPLGSFKHILPLADECFVNLSFTKSKRKRNSQVSADPGKLKFRIFIFRKFQKFRNVVFSKKGIQKNYSGRWHCEKCPCIFPDSKQHQILANLKKLVQTSYNLLQIFGVVLLLHQHRDEKRNSLSKVGA